MIHTPGNAFDSLSLAAQNRVDEACLRFEAAWKKGQQPRLEDFVAPFTGAERLALLRELILLDVCYRRAVKETPRLEEYQERFPDLDATWSPDVRAQEQLAVPGYELLGELGRGGMGVVYKARQVGLNRVVALKMILAGAHAGPNELRRFRQEAEAVAALQHPHIVQIHEIGDHQGLSYFSLEYVAGGSLAARLDGTPWPPSKAAALVETLAHAVEAAHHAGIIHRDLKPANVLLTAEGTPKIGDFGLAKKQSAAGETHSGAVLGTPSYMAPEQAAGESRRVGPAADIYALGAILYELLIGRPPFKAASAMGTVVLVLHEEPVPPRSVQPHLPRNLETICLKCLAKQPARRYPTAAALAEDLRRFQAGEPITARPAGITERTVRWVRRRPALAGLLLVGLLALLALTSGGLWFTLQLKSERDRALFAESQAEDERSRAQQAEAVARQDRDRALDAEGRAKQDRDRALDAEGRAKQDRDRALEANRRRVRSLVEQLCQVPPQAVPALLSNLAEERDAILPRLRERWADSTSDRKQRMRAGLALLPIEPDLVRRDLAAWLLEAEDPAEVLLVRDVLIPHKDALREELWGKTEDTAALPVTRLRALAALAAFDPDNPRWLKQAATAAEQMLTANPLHPGIWVQGLRPVRSILLKPLSDAFRTAPSADRREVAAVVLADYAADRLEVLVDLILDADQRQFVVLYPRLYAHSGAAALLQKELRRQFLGRTREANRLALARRQANAAATLVRLGQPEAAWPFLRQTADPTRRSYLIQRLALLGVEARVLAERLDEEPDESARRALILALGEYGPEQVPPALRESLTTKLLARYRTEPDAGVHAAIDWLLRHGKEGPEPRRLDWSQAQALEQIDDDLKGKAPAEGQRWSVSRTGLTLALCAGPVIFRMGAPPDESGQTEHETPHSQRIGHSFALATKPITVTQWQRFLKAHPEVKHAYTKLHSPDDAGPIVAVTWYEAAQYCRWLSEEEGVADDQMCYPTVAEIEKCKEGGAPLKLPGDYLTRTGYRLPTEAEWEYACRAGTTTAFSYGRGDELLPRYAWYLKNAQDRTWPVGQKRPNDFGLFDMHGNVWCWCQESSAGYRIDTGGKPTEDVEDTREITDRANRVLRGGSFDDPPPYLRSAMRNVLRPSIRTNTVCLRPARTLP